MKRMFKVLGKILLGFSSLIIITSFTSLGLVANEEMPKSIKDHR